MSDMSGSSQPEQHSTTSPLTANLDEVFGEQQMEPSSLLKTESAKQSIDWQEAILLLSNLHHRMESSIPEIHKDISIPKEVRVAAIQNIRGEMRGIMKGIEACRRIVSMTAEIHSTAPGTASTTSDPKDN